MGMVMFVNMGVLPRERIHNSGEQFVMDGDTRHFSGSVTKSMTATLLMILIQNGNIDGGWDATLQSLIPEAVGTPYAECNLRELVGCLCGIRHQAPDWYSYTQLLVASTVQEQRRLAVVDALQADPVCIPKTAYSYSTTSFVVAGHIIEKITDMTWEDPLRIMLFQPLGVDLGTDPASFTGSPEGPTDPWGHNSMLEACNPTTDIHNCRSYVAQAPGATFSGPVEAMAAYFAFHLNCHNGLHTSLLTQENCQLLHTPAPGCANYGYGWRHGVAAWAGGDGKVIFHAGTNGLHLYYVYVAFGINKVFVGYTNSRRGCNDQSMIGDALFGCGGLVESQASASSCPSPFSDKAFENTIAIESIQDSSTSALSKVVSKVLQSWTSASIYRWWQADFP